VKTVLFLFSTIKKFHIISDPGRNFCQFPNGLKALNGIPALKLPTTALTSASLICLGIVGYIHDMN
jgi:hypothetical protein